MRRRIFFFLIYTLLILLIGFGLGRVSSRYQVSVSQKVKPVEISQEATSTGEIAGQISNTDKAKVKRVIDGDTIELNDRRKLRYIGIDAPETVDPGRAPGCFGKEATLKNQELVLDKEIELEKDVSEIDRFARLLRYVYVDIPGQGRVMVNEWLVREGYAFSSTYPPDVKYQELFRKAELEARDANRGLWGHCWLNSPTASGITNPTEQTSENAQNLGVTTNSNTQDNPSGCVIKGNISTSGEKIYHLPGCGSYEKTVIDETNGERIFCSEAEAESAGWRKAKNC